MHCSSCSHWGQQDAHALCHLKYLQGKRAPAIRRGNLNLLEFLTELNAQNTGQEHLLKKN